MSQPRALPSSPVESLHAIKLSSSDIDFKFSSSSQKRQSIQQNSQPQSEQASQNAKRALQSIESSFSLPSTHDGVRLDQVTQYLQWFSSVCPAESRQSVEATIEALQTRFLPPGAALKKAAVRGVFSSTPRDGAAGADVNASGLEREMLKEQAEKAEAESSVEKSSEGKSFETAEEVAEVDEAEKENFVDPQSASTTPVDTRPSPFLAFGKKAGPGGQMTFQRSISTSRKQNINRSQSSNARLELLTQKADVWSTGPIAEPAEASTASTTAPKRLHSVHKTVKPIRLSEEQQNIIELARLGHSLFFTGSAGTGKSLLLKSLIKALKAQHEPETVGVTASTGLAACNIGGMTLHSFTGIGIGTGTPQELVKKVKRNQKSRERWRKMEVLVVDEISMVDGRLLDKLDFIGKKMKKNNMPFGGIQLVVCGDFYQLPPVSKESDAQFAFESEAWKRGIRYSIILKHVFRQQGDRDFVRMLNEVREGRVSEATARKLKALERPLQSKEGVIPAQLFPRRQQVDYANRQMLQKIEGEPVKFESIDGGSVRDEKMREKMLSNFLCPATVTLKKGAQVMMIKNIDETLVNGSLGKVIDFMDPDTYALLNHMHYGDSINEESVEELAQSIAEKDDNGTSRDKRLIRESSKLPDQLDDSIFDFMKDVAGDKPSVQESINRKKALVNKLYSASKGRRLPWVRFVLSDGTTRDVLVEPEIFSMDDEAQKPLVSRTQIPLILAWALSIHKAQGQTLPLVRIDLGRVFEKGQAYVGLSRATSRRGLQVSNFHPDRIMAHDKVVEFYKNLIDTQDAIDSLKGGDANVDKEEESERGMKRTYTTAMETLEHLNSFTANASSFETTKDNIASDVRMDDIKEEVESAFKEKEFLG